MVKTDNYFIFNDTLLKKRPIMIQIRKLVPKITKLAPPVTPQN